MTPITRTTPGCGRGVALVSAVILGACVLSLWAVSLWVVSHRSMTRAADADPAARADRAEPGLSDEALLARAAKARFGDHRPRVRLADGRVIAPEDEGVVENLRVKMFKRALADEAEAQDPSFRALAQARLRAQAPRAVRLRWEDPTGPQEMALTVADTRGCDLPASGETLELEPTFVRRCIEASRDEVPPWADAESPVTLEVNDVVEDTPTWRRLSHGAERELAAEHFLQRARRGPQALDDAGVAFQHVLLPGEGRLPGEGS